MEAARVSKRACDEGRLTLDKGIVDVRSQRPAGVVLFRPDTAGRRAVISFIREEISRIASDGPYRQSDSRRPAPHSAAVNNARVRERKRVYRSLSAQKRVTRGKSAAWVNLAGFEGSDFCLARGWHTPESEDDWDMKKGC